MNASQKKPKNAGNQIESKITGHEQQIIDTSSIGVLITRISDGTILYANKAIADLFGTPDVSSVVGKPVPDLYWDAEERKAILKRFQADGSVKDSELRARRADGSMTWVSISIQPFNFEGEQVLLTEIVDISERKRAERAQQESEERFRSLYNNSTIGLYRTTPGGQILMINPTGLHLLGFDSFEELAERNLEEAGFEEEDARKNFREKLEREGIIEQESVWTKKDGTPIFVRESSTVSRDENGNILYYDGSFEDITAHKQAEEALRASEERFKRFTEATIEGLVFHEQGKIIDVNPAAVAIFGLTNLDELIGRNLLEFIVPEYHQTVLKQMQLESVAPYEIQGIRKDGSTIPVETSTRAYHDGKRIIRASSIRNITERKQADQALRESQQLLQLVMDNIPQAVFWKDKELTYLGANQAFAEDAGFSSPQELAGKKDFDMPWKEQAEFYRADDQRVLNLGETKLNYEEPQTGPTGNITWLRTSKIPMRDANGNVFAVLGMYEDITQSKQAEQALRDSQQLLQTVMDNIPQSIFWKDRNLTYLGCNSAFAADTGLASPSDVVGKTDWDLSSKDRAEFYREDDSIVLKNEIPKLNFEEPQTHADGLTHWLRTSKVPLHDVDGNVSAVLGMYEDITERKNLEQRVQEAFERRGYQVQVSTEISQEVAATTELSDLFERVVTLTKERLGYYHTQLLRYDAAQDAVVLISGYGDIGQKMLAGGHQMPMGEGLIGTAAASGETVLRSTLADDLDWHPNPLLPDTQGEIAVPIKWQNTVLGVLDVQSNQAGALSDDDRLLFEGLCGQIAIAMHNAELVEIVRQNEARLAEALKAARLANWEYDVEKDIFTFNDQFYSIFHTTAEKAGGYQLSSARYAELFVHPNDLEVVGTEIGKALSSTDRVYNTTIDHRIRYEDGGVGYIMVQLTVERDENGKITRYYGANQDITERKQAEEALRVNEARLAEALRAARLGNWEYDFENDLFIFTDDFYSIFRTSAERVGGYKISSADYSKNFVHPDDAPLVGIEIQKVLDAKDRLFTTHLEHRIIFPDGEVGYIAVNINVERDENGKITRWYGANQDITERKQAEEALRVNEARLTEALKIARLANWEYDVEKDIFTFNDQFYSLFHTTAEQHGGYQLSSAYYAQHFVYPDDLPIVGVEIEQALNSTGRHYSRNIEHRILYADGGVGHFQVNINVERDENGKITRYFGANQDITERKKEQEALAERLEEINRLYSSMSREGWKTYRETADLPTGFVFDQAGVKPVGDMVFADENFAQVPMKVLGGEVVGTLSVANDPRNPTSLEDLVFLQQVSDQVALALEGARLSAQTQSALAQTEKLSEAGLLFTRATDLQEVVKIAVETLGISEINRAALETFNYNSANEVESMDVVANWWNGIGHQTTEVGTRYTPQVLPLIQLFLTPIPMFIKDAFQDERVDGVSLQIVKRLNIHAVAVLPLFQADKQIGVLLLESEEIHEFNQDEIRLYSAMGPQISTVLENRRQFERAQQQAQRESALNVISQKIQSATTVEAVLQIAARELGHALGAPMTIAQLSMKDKK